MNAYAPIQTRNGALSAVHQAAETARQYAVTALIAELKPRVGKDLSEVLDMLELIHNARPEAHFEAAERLAKVAIDIVQECEVEE